MTPKISLKSKWFWTYLGFVGLVFALGLIQVKKNFIDYPIYERAALKIWTRDLVNFYEPGRVTPNGNYYPYFWAFLFVPIAICGPFVGKFLFMLLFFGAYFYLLNFSARLAWGDRSAAVDLSSGEGAQPDTDTRLKHQILLMIPTLFLINDAFMNSNIGLLLAVLLVMAFQVRARKPGWGALLLALPIVIKVYPALMLGFFGWERRWKMLLSTVGICVFFYFGVPALIEGWQTAVRLTGEHIYVVSHYDDQINWGYDNFIFQNIPGTFIRYGALLGLPLKVAYRVAMATSLAAILWFLRISFQANARGLNRERSQRYFALAMALVPMLTPISWFNMALFYLPLMAYVVKRAFFERHRRSQIMFGLFFVLYCLTTRDLVGRELCHALLRLSVPFMGIVFLVTSFVLDLVEFDARLQAESSIS